MRKSLRQLQIGRPVRQRMLRRRGGCSLTFHVHSLPFTQNQANPALTASTAPPSTVATTKAISARASR